jgi:cupin fold WbuC family metalloprotein
MGSQNIPHLSSDEKNFHFDQAFKSIRRRSPKILHKKGDYLNKVFNFILNDSYMQPHLHPGIEKIEKMHLLEGSFALILFNNSGNIDKTIILEKGKKDFVEVPAFTWHTYLMISQKVIVYETMDGKYAPESWKKMAPWAPIENTPEAKKYLEKLKIEIQYQVDE